MEGTVDDKEPIAGLSAASSCIRLSLGSSEQSVFRPVYTHQCFKDECLPGWRPMADAESRARLLYQSWRDESNTLKITNEDGEVHQSFEKCQIDGNNNSRIDIHVKLTPSCTNCEIDMQTIESDESENNCDGNVCKKARTVRFEQPDDGNSQSLQRMTYNDILQHLAPAVPPISSVCVNGTTYDGWEHPIQNDQNTKFSQYLDQPIGRVVKSYQRKIKGTSEDANFVISIADGTDEQASHYQRSVQKLARWFIETADDVDISGKFDDADSGGFWSVVYLFREHLVGNHSDNEQQKAQYSLAGYITLFHFQAPFKKPEPGIIVRICQALILPPYQRAGHGSDLLRTVYEYAEQYATDGLKIVEVNVEDPAPGFVALRDFVDFHRYSDFIAVSGQADSTAAVMDEQFFSPILDDEQQNIASSLKITKRQAQIVHEMRKLEQLENWKQTLNGSESCSLIKDKETQYRLMLKKSLRNIHKEELGACTGGKEEQKALLERWFQESFAHYRKLLGV